MDLNAGKLSGGLTLDTSKFTGPLRDAVSAATTGATSLQTALNRPFAPAAAEADKLTASAGSLGSALKHAAGEASSLSLASTVAGTAIGGVLAAGISSAVGAATSLVGTLGGIAVTGVKLAAQAESTSLALTTMIGDSTTAAALLKDLRAFANSTPFGFAELANASKQLLAMGIDAKDVVGSLKMIGDVSSGLGQPVGEMAYLFGQIKSQGRAMTQDLNQFAGRGVPIYRELAKVLKTNELGVRDFAETGRIGFAEIQQAFVGMTSAGGQFYGMTDQQSRSLAGLYSTLQDAIEDVEKSLGEAITTGVDGHTLLKDITTQVEQLKPSVVGLGVALAQAFSTALPYVKATLEYAQALAVTLGIIDPSKLYPDAYKSDKSAAIDGAQNNAESADRLGRVQQGISQGASAAGGTIKELEGNPLRWAKSITAAQLALIQGSQTADRLQDDIQAKFKAGGKVTDEEFNALRDRVKQNVALMANLQQAINTGLPNFDDAYVAKLNAVQANLRSRQNDTAKALDEFAKLGREQSEKSKDDAARKQTAEWADPSTASPAATTNSAAPATGGQTTSAAPSPGTPVPMPNGTAGATRGSGSYNLAAELEKMQLARLTAAGKKEEAALLEAKIARDREFARIDAASNSGSLSFGDSIHASRAVAEAYEVDVAEVRKRFAKERADAEDKAREKRQNADDKTTRHNAELSDKLTQVQERTAAYRLSTQAAALEAQGRHGEAELLRFDAEWKKRLAAIKDDGERSAAYSQYQLERVLKLKDAAVSVGDLSNGDVRRRKPRREVFDPSQGMRLGIVDGRADKPADAPTSIFGGIDLPLAKPQQRTRVVPVLLASPDRNGGALRDADPLLNLRDNLGNPTTAGDRARRVRFGERLTPPSLPTPDVFRVPSPFAGLSARLSPPGSTSGQAAPPGPPVVNVTPVVNVDEKKVAAACVEALKPVIYRGLNNLRGELNAANHASGVAGRI